MRMRRPARGFSLIEAMVASTILLLGMTGVSVFVIQASRISRRGGMNTQMVQIARDEINRRAVQGIASVGMPTSPNTPIRVALSPPGCVPGTPKCSFVVMDVEVFDTSPIPPPPPSPQGPPNQLPDCPNIGVASRCIRVTVTDSTIDDPSQRSPLASRYQEAFYVAD